MDENAELRRVERNGVDITEKLSAEQANALKILSREAQCARWRSGGDYPLRDGETLLAQALEIVGETT